MLDDLTEEYRALQYDLESGFLAQELHEDGSMPPEDMAGLCAYGVSEHIRKIIDLTIAERLSEFSELIRSVADGE